jgi:hypothetical protein
MWKESFTIPTALFAPVAHLHHPSFFMSAETDCYLRRGSEKRNRYK